ncbi:MAG: hypothetical protein D6788_11810 [Planctomycetota bacterium]|nr:MAG: hypothetical protein D6788_11810 [Planctomycetota bacterium]
MVGESTKSLQDLVRKLRHYPEEAFLFVREGLSFAAEQVHGPETEAHRLLQQFLAQNDMDWDDLIRQYHTGNLPEPVREVIDAAGGCENLNRHVSGRELCWALRDYALKRWGLLARTVLESWNIRSTEDFGRIVFGFIEFDMMRKQEGDSIEDFIDVYRFDEVFEEPYRRQLLEGSTNGKQKPS